MQSCAEVVLNLPLIVIKLPNKFDRSFRFDRNMPHRIGSFLKLPKASKDGRRRSGSSQPFESVAVDNRKAHLGPRH